MGVCEDSSLDKSVGKKYDGGMDLFEKEFKDKIMGLTDWI